MDGVSALSRGDPQTRSDVSSSAGSTDRFLTAAPSRASRPGQPPRATPAVRLPAGDDRFLLADKGYDADFILVDLQARGITAVIPAKRNRKVQPVIDGHVYLGNIHP